MRSVPNREAKRRYRCISNMETRSHRRARNSSCSCSKHSGPDSRCQGSGYYYSKPSCHFQLQPLNHTHQCHSQNSASSNYHATPLLPSANRKRRRNKPVNDQENLNKKQEHKRCNFNGVPIKCSIPCIKDFSILASPVSVKSERNKSFIQSITPPNICVKTSPVTPSLMNSQSLLPSLKRPSSVQLPKPTAPVSHRLTNRSVSYPYNIKREPYNSTMIDLTITPSVKITKLDLPKHKIIVNTPLITIKIEEAELGNHGNSEGGVSAISTPKPMERAEPLSQDNNHSNNIVMIKPKRKSKHKTHLCHRKSKTGGKKKKSDPTTNEQVSYEVAMPTNQGPWQIKEECTPLLLESPLQNGPVDWATVDEFVFSRAVVSVPVTSDNFWELVARNMGDKFTAKDCQEHSMETVKSPAATLSETEERVVSGTVTRQKQLRGVLKPIDNGYHDNLLDSTPIQKHIVVKPLRKVTSEKIVEGEKGVTIVRGSNGYKEGPCNTRARDLTGIKNSQRSLFKLFSEDESDDETEDKCNLVLGYLDSDY